MIDIKDAADEAIYNASKIKKDTICSCYCCCSTYTGENIQEYIDNERTALCPVCGIDAVIPEKIEEEKLEEMYKFWFAEK